jgi:hypothetical protein
MKLIFQYNWDSEPCYGTTIFPVEYSSKDDLLLDFQIACEESLKSNKDLNFFEGLNPSWSDFFSKVYSIKKSNYLDYELIYDGPTVYTLEEWLENNTAIPKTI